MKAYVCTRYGPPEVLKLREIPRPEPKADQVLIRVHAVPATVGDCRIRGFRVPPSYRVLARIALGFTRPRSPILGGYYAGVVAAAGKKVTRFSVGDRVFGCTAREYGTYAEFIRVSQKECLALIPPPLSFEEAAASLWGNGTALHFLRKAAPRKEQHILINGGSGSVGLAGVQLAKYFGMTVTAVCSGKNIDLVQAAGADLAIDYTTTDFTQNSDAYDTVFDTVGNLPVSRLFNCVKPGGLLLHAVGTPDVVSTAKKLCKTTGKRFVGGTFTWKQEMLDWIVERVANHEAKPFIDSTYSFHDMPSAHHRVDSGRKTGDVIVTIP